MKFMMVAVQVMIAMFCLYHGSSVTTAAIVQDVTQKEPQITIMLERVYLDGEVSEEIFTEKVVNLEKFLQEYREWQLVDRDDVQIVLQKRMDDISPLLKTSGYFGVSKNGILQIFNGVPKSDNAIQSFFQIDMKKLESYEREQLKRGIRIKSKERFVKTIEEMKQYAVQSSKNSSSR
ncbi:BofC C-terminal domain-containing protein [Bacillus sp. DX4.1]|uniref:BofC C-terminal domain-containing protein n=1 Tax=Bacillus sp. DX4.1 TaxID=3055867 RepID=UPI0025A06243|nr:BofC C-terminal domain-containing protein [Bacillus sp. DX4.1]MDM5190129.1 BofC C-terminal domain-containing protein [Bacillus sp. DX4.1]